MDAYLEIDTRIDLDISEYMNWLKNQNLANISEAQIFLSEFLLSETKNLNSTCTDSPPFSRDSALWIWSQFLV